MSIMTDALMTCLLPRNRYTVHAKEVSKSDVLVQRSAVCLRVLLFVIPSCITLRITRRDGAVASRNPLFFSLI